MWEAVAEKSVSLVAEKSGLDPFFADRKVKCLDALKKVASNVRSVIKS